MAASVLVAASCSSASHEPPPTTRAPVTTAAPTTSTVPVAPTFSITHITGATGAVTDYASVAGSGSAQVAIPAGVGVPAIAHAKYGGTGSFTVSGLDAQGHHLAVLATSLGSYDGTFPVGFVGQANHPTTMLAVETTGPWHLDLANPVVAPELRGAGVSGHGDAVLSYRGPATSAHFSYPGTSELTVSTFGGGRVTMLVKTVGPLDGPIALPAGPAFVSVTAAGDWSMTLGRK